MNHNDLQRKRNYVYDIEPLLRLAVDAQTQPDDRTRLIHHARLLSAGVNLDGIEPRLRVLLDPTYHPPQPAPKQRKVKPPCTRCGTRPQHARGMCSTCYVYTFRHKEQEP